MSQTTTPSGAHSQPFTRTIDPLSSELDWLEEWLKETTPCGGEAAYSAVRNVSAAVAALIARNAELEAKTALQMGVGDGAGQLFVYGDYDSIKAAQALVLRLEALAAENKALREAAINLVIDPEDPNIGWRGRASADDVFACEHCKSEHFDCTALIHDDSCPVPAMIEAARIALARTPAATEDKT